MNSSATEIVAGSGPCSYPGDSGALVWRRRDAAAMGMILAAADGPDDVVTTYVPPLQPTLTALGATPLTT
jgi:hypothetical protein